MPRGLVWVDGRHIDVVIPCVRNKKIVGSNKDETIKHQFSNPGHYR